MQECFKLIANRIQYEVWEFRCNQPPKCAARQHVHYYTARILRQRGIFRNQIDSNHRAKHRSRLEESIRNKPQAASQFQ